MPVKPKPKASTIKDEQFNQIDPMNPKTFPMLDERLIVLVKGGFRFYGYFNKTLFVPYYERLKPYNLFQVTGWIYAKDVD